MPPACSSLKAQGCQNATVWSLRLSVARRSGLFGGAATGTARVADLVRRRAALEHLVDNTEFHRFVGFEEGVAVERLLDVGQRAAGVLGVKIVHPRTDAEDFLGL